MKNPAWVVKNVIAQEDYTLLLTFENGERRLYDARPLLRHKINEKLNNIGFFLQAKAKYGTVIWTDEIDVDPESLYEHSVPI